MEIVAVIDFETTGLSPAQGDRATEIAAVIVEDGKVVDRYQSLMNAGVRIPSFIESLTGISDAMIRQAPPAAEVMQAVSDFVGDLPLVAHNASFDCKFWDAELARIQRGRQKDFICSLLLSRRIFPQAPSHKLSALIEYARLPVAGRYHRALADAEMAASLLLRLEEELQQRHGVTEVSPDFLRQIQRVPKNQLAKCIASRRR
ncbi:3'-5' exonuclease [Zoogloea dura]|uniref:DNA-directed DNA polymerase n=1 Tax=Zoogloea dura TaxID=2728840 RepID=A0A848FZA8_9RHOO|nr:3'-5' exonuclease [Zoogloea dura]NML24414.1 3'-5' exonuclease [Zoogloea dura]